jgi:hypothetical protein
MTASFFDQRAGRSRCPRDQFKLELQGIFRRDNIKNRFDPPPSVLVWGALRPPFRDLAPPCPANLIATGSSGEKC